MSNLIKTLEHKIQNIELSPLQSKLAMIPKVVGLHCIDFINKWYKKPKWDADYEVDGNLPTIKELVEKYEDDFKFNINNGIFINSMDWDGTINDGDELLFNGIYSAYNSMFGDGKYFEKVFLPNFLIHDANDKLVLLRNIPGRLDTTGDQLTGFLLACSEHKKRHGFLPDKVFLFLNNFIHLKTFNNNNPECNYKPNLLSINGDCIHLLTVCALVEKWDYFLKYYNEYSYKYMLKFASIYLYDDKYKFGNRNWFSCNIALINLCIIYQELIQERNIFKSFNYNVRINIRKSIYKILNANKHNLFFWLLAFEAHVIIKAEIPQEAISYFETFRITKGVYDSKLNKMYPPYNYIGSLMPLGLSKANWIWEREPYKIHYDNLHVFHLDIVFTYYLKKKCMGDY